MTRTKICMNLIPLLAVVLVGGACDDSKERGAEVSPPGDIAPELQEELADAVELPPGDVADVPPEEVADVPLEVDAAEVHHGDVAQDQSPEVTDPVEVRAVTGARCPSSARIGVITITPGLEQHNLHAILYDRPHPAYGAPALSTEVCDFHVQPVGCVDCGELETCGVGGVCAALPVAREDVMVALWRGELRQVFERNHWWGGFGGAIEIGPGPYSLELELAQGAIRVVSDALDVPGELEAVKGVLKGGSEAPQSLTLTWEGGEEGAHVFTHIPINHHVGGPTFTECQVDATVGEIAVGEAMLAPLAVVTGLEFQGMEHVVFAAAQTTVGCVELRLQRGAWVSLE